MANHEALEQKLASVLTPPPQEVFFVKSHATLEDATMGILNMGYDAGSRAWGYAQEFGVSYRDYLVGAAALLYHPHERYASVIYGYNVKLSDGEVPNIHAEDLIQVQLELCGGYIVGLIIVAIPKPDDATGVMTQNLLPCSARCEPKLRNNPQAIQSALILGMDPTNGATTATTLRGLREIYRGLHTPSIYGPQIDGDSWSDALLVEIAQSAPDIAHDLSHVPAPPICRTQFVYGVSPTASVLDYVPSTTSDLPAQITSIAITENARTLIVNKPPTQYVGII